MEQVALTADSLSLGDLVESRIRGRMAWSMLPVQAMYSSVLPGEYMSGQITAQINFPGWLGKYSKTQKRSRLAQEIHDHTRIRYVLTTYLMLTQPFNLIAIFSH